MKNLFKAIDNGSGIARRLWSRREVIGALGLTLAACGGQSPPTPSFSSAIGNWRKQFDGRVVTLADNNYEHWRTGMPWQMWTADRKPAVIVRPNNRDAVIDAVNFARDNGLKIAIKSGGHNVSESFLRNDGMLLDLGELQAVEVDPQSQTAWVEPALWSQLLIERTEPHGLAFPVAHCATVPMGGYLLGGGVGVNGDEWGSVACHAIIAADVVTAQGESITISEKQYPALFWAVRGAGTGFFGVVTRYKIQLYPMPTHIYESLYFFPLEAVEQASRFLSDIANSGVRKTELMMLLAHNPAAPPDAPASARKVCVARIVTFADSEDEAKMLLKGVREHPVKKAAVMQQEMVPSSFTAMAEASIDANAGLGFGRYAVDTFWSNKPSESLAAIKDLFARAPDDTNHVVVSYKINPRLRKDAAFSIIGGAFIGTYAVWSDEAKDKANFSWVKQLGEALLPHAQGQYINEVDGFNDPGAIERCYSPESWERLRRLRKQYDPDGVFHDYV